MKVPFLSTIMLALVALTPMAQAATQTIPISKTLTLDNFTVNISGTITVDTTVQTISGTISVTVTNNTSGQTVFSRTITFSQSIGSNGDATTVLAVPVFPDILAVSCFTSTGSASSSCLLSRDPDINHDGKVNVLDLVAVGRTFSTSFPGTDLYAEGTVNIRDLTLVALDFGAPIFA